MSALKDPICLKCGNRLSRGRIFAICLSCECIYDGVALYDWEPGAPSKTAPPIPNGYELLAAGSVLRKGDKFWNIDEWVLSRLGNKEYDGSGLYIRPIAPVNHAVSLAPLLDPEPDYLTPTTVDANWRVIIECKDRQSASKVFNEIVYARISTSNMAADCDTAEVCVACKAPWTAGDNGDSRCCLKNARAYAEKVNTDYDDDAFKVSAVDVAAAWKQVADMATAALEGMGCEI